MRILGKRKSNTFIYYKPGSRLATNISSKQQTQRAELISYLHDMQRLGYLREDKNLDDKGRKVFYVKNTQIVVAAGNLEASAEGTATLEQLLKFACIQNKISHPKVLNSVRLTPFMNAVIKDQDMKAVLKDPGFKPSKEKLFTIEEIEHNRQVAEQEEWNKKQNKPLVEAMLKYVEAKKLREEKQRLEHIRQQELDAKRGIPQGKQIDITKVESKRGYFTSFRGKKYSSASSTDASSGNSSPTNSPEPSLTKRSSKRHSKENVSINNEPPKLRL